MRGLPGGYVDAVPFGPALLLGQPVQLLAQAPAVVGEAVLPDVALEEGQLRALLGREAQQGAGPDQLRRQEGGDDQVLRCAAPDVTSRGVPGRAKAAQPWLESMQSRPRGSKLGRCCQD